MRLPRAVTRRLKRQAEWVELFNRKERELSVDEVRAAWSKAAPETVPVAENVRQTVAQRTAGRSPFLVVEEVAARYRGGRRGSDRSQTHRADQGEPGL